MRVQFSFSKMCVTTVIAAVFSANDWALSQEASAVATTPPPVPSEELPAGCEALASGPVHEAFASPVASDAQTSVTVSVQPPAPLQEAPPENKPAVAGVVWVPGYWAWDANRNDFVWVSGCWRNPPPNTCWVAGYWLQVGSAWQWVNGYWAAVSAAQTVEYLPAPPAPQETDPTVMAQNTDLIWVPGCWYWTQGRYSWRRGYWITPQPGWVWAPSHYVWTPRGYVFCSGHWDYDLDTRGVLFAPTYFSTTVRVGSRFVYCPSVCVDLGALRLNLFAYPRYHHYYFGDYYDDSFRVMGIYPWFQCQTLHVWYDPIFMYDRWHYRKTEPRWAEERQRDFERRHSNRDLRPLRTFAEVQARSEHGHRMGVSSDRPLVQPFSKVVSSPKASVHFEKMNGAERQRLIQHSVESHAGRENGSHGGAPNSPVSSSGHGFTAPKADGFQRSGLPSGSSSPVTVKSDSKIGPAFRSNPTAKTDSDDRVTSGKMKKNALPTGTGMQTLQGKADSGSQPVSTKVRSVQSSGASESPVSVKPVTIPVSQRTMTVPDVKSSDSGASERAFRTMRSDRGSTASVQPKVQQVPSNVRSVGKEQTRGDSNTRSLRGSTSSDRADQDKDDSSSRRR